MIEIRCPNKYFRQLVCKENVKEKQTCRHSFFAVYEMARGGGVAFFQLKNGNGISFCVCKTPRPTNPNQIFSVRIYSKRVKKRKSFLTSRWSQLRNDAIRCRNFFCIRRNDQPLTPPPGRSNDLYEEPPWSYSPLPWSRASELYHRSSSTSL